MSREWKPGDVALVEAGCWANRKVALRLDEGWSHVNGVNVDGDGIVSPVRPLVVIDPEDREQVERLTKSLVEAAFRHGNVVVSDQGIHPDTMVEALRSLTAPPKPEEPTKLGHVITDTDGVRWVRGAPVEAPYEAPWYSYALQAWRTYEDIDVTAEGVTA